MNKLTTAQLFLLASTPELLKFKGIDNGIPRGLRPYIICTDGFKMSVQASYTHYCEPKENGPQNYTQVEIGFPSEKEELLFPYAELPSEFPDTVCCYVPVEVLDAVIEKHGGIASLSFENRRRK